MSELSDTYPTSANQRLLCFVHQLAPDSAAGLVAVAARVRGTVDAVALRRAADQVAARHPALRTTFHRDGLAQRVHDRLDPDFRHLDARGWSEERLAAEVGTAAWAPLDPLAGPPARVTLLTVGDTDHRLVLTAHHLVADLWSLPVVLDDLDHAYRAATAGTDLERPALPATHADHVRRQAERLAGDRGKRLREFWSEELAGVTGVLELPTDHPRPSPRRLRAATERFGLDATSTERLRAVARDADVPLHTVLLTAFQVLLARRSGQDDVLVGVPVHGRNAAVFSGVVGCFTNTLAVRCRPRRHEPFSTVLAGVDRAFRRAIRHGELPFADVLDVTGVARDASRSPLVQAVFTWQQARGGGKAVALALGSPEGAQPEMGGLRLEPQPVDHPGSQFDLMLWMGEAGDGLDGLLHYDTDLFTPETAARTTEQLRALLVAVADDPHRPVARLPLITAAERARAVADATGASATGADAEFAHHMVTARAARSPGAIAVAADEAGVMGGTAELTYAQLDAHADRLARHLVRHGVGPETVVAILLPRTPDVAVGMLAVLKAGGAYLPLDTALPPGRIGYLLDDSGAQVVLCGTATRSALPATTARVVVLDADRADIDRLPARPPAVAVHPDSAAFVIHTSGSTGRPKGVVVPHRALGNFLAHLGRRLPLGPGDRWAATATLSFDISVLEFFHPLVSGATTHIMRRDVLGDSQRLRGAVEDAGAALTHLQLTPVSWTLLLETGWRPSPGLTMLSGGDLMTRQLAEQLIGGGAALWSLYGPTETTIYCSGDPVTGAGDAVPLGRPFDNCRMYVLDDCLEPVAPGEIGEVYVGGACLARGYSRQPGLTAGRFVADPVSGVPGARLYRTGDLARYRADGGLEFAGRVDNQVKIRGHRIELGEVEAALTGLPLVRRAVAVVRGDGPDRTLVAYLEPDGPGEDAESRQGPGSEGIPIPQGADRARDERRLRADLGAFLPGYLIPSSFVWLDRLPITARGKIDRAALPPVTREPRSPATAAPAATRTETRIAALAGELLNRDPVGRDESLFDLGADSLVLSRLAMRIRESLGAELPLGALFREPTVAAAARAVEAARTTAPAGPPPAARVRRVDRAAYTAVWDAGGAPAPSDPGNASRP